MVQKSRLAQFVCVAIFVACMIDSSLAAWGSKRAPAGQVCPGGSYVIGFDAEANIIVFSLFKAVSKNAPGKGVTELSGASISIGATYENDSSST